MSLQNEVCRAAAGKAGALLKENANEHARDLVQSLLADLNRIDREMTELETAQSRHLSLLGATPQHTIPAEYDICKFTKTEASLLESLYLVRRKTLTKVSIYNYMYPTEDGPELKIVDVVMCKVRRKLRRHGDALKAAGLLVRIETVWGVGYSLVEGEPVAHFHGCPRRWES